MGAKQSKRSVDISGKEAEGGGEVAAAGAGGEGRVEQLADADALKPQLNGDAHIQNETSDKEKDLDSGTPENEKDATTEKEGKEEEQEEKESPPVTNGDSEPKENGESTPLPEDGKKPKKEKVKKKWSLRSISFSRKDKPKQEKKQKEDEPKTNGEPEKVPEETAEATPEAAVNEIAEEAQAPAEDKEEKTPETPVTEPLTNGSSTPSSGAAESPAVEEARLAEPELQPAPAPAPAPESQPEPEQLPVNGLSLDEHKQESLKIANTEENKPEPPAPETAEIVPAPEIPKEVCVERMPLLESTPPPLPANPPPSSVASFAATTMAPELTDALLANNADAANAPLDALPDTNRALDLPAPHTDTLPTDPPSVLKEAACLAPPRLVNDAVEPAAAADVNPPEVEETPEVENVTKDIPETIVEPVFDTLKPAVVADVESVVENIIETAEKEEPAVVDKVDLAVVDKAEPAVADRVKSAIGDELNPAAVETAEPAATETSETVIEAVQAAIPVVEAVISESIENVSEKLASTATNVPKIGSQATDATISEISVPEVDPAGAEAKEKETELPVRTIVEPVVAESIPEPESLPEPEPEVSEPSISEADDSSLPPPPAQDELAATLEDVDDRLEESSQQLPEPIGVTTPPARLAAEMTNGVNEDGVSEAVPASDVVTCNGGSPPAAPPAVMLNGAATEAPRTPQEPLPVSDKLADLIPEVPDVPELKTETLQETATDVAVAN